MMKEIYPINIFSPPSSENSAEAKWSYKWASELVSISEQNVTERMEYCQDWHICGQFLIIFRTSQSEMEINCEAFAHLLIKGKDIGKGIGMMSKNV